MKIILVHNYYQEYGGEDAVVHSEMSLLRMQGHKVELFALDNDDINSLGKKVKTWLWASYSKTSRHRLRSQIFRLRPDVVHVHNFFPLLTPSVYDAAHDANVPIIQTLHNFRTICPGAFLMNRGKTCEKCLTSSAYRSILYGCYRNSRLGTIAVAHMVQTHRNRQTWSKKVDRFIVLTNFCKKKFVKGLFPANKIAIKPNFVEEPQLRHDFFSLKNAAPLGSALFVGRVSPEKGVLTLIKAWKDLNMPLRIVGDGSLLEKVRASAFHPISVLGRKTPSHVRLELENAAFLILPSECYESFPMVLVEAFAHGCPAVVSRLGSMAEIVEDGITGLHFESANAEDLAQKVQWMCAHPEECKRMGENARCVYEKKYTPKRNYELLMAIYQEAIDEHKEGAD